MRAHTRHDHRDICVQSSACNNTYVENSVICWSYMRHLTNVMQITQQLAIGANKVSSRVSVVPTMPSSHDYADCEGTFDLLCVGNIVPSFLVLLHIAYFAVLISMCQHSHLFNRLCTENANILISMRVHPDSDFKLVHRSDAKVRLATTKNCKDMRKSIL